jgi:hypothetical protein
LSSIRLPVLAKQQLSAVLPIPATPLEEVMDIGSSYSLVESIECSACGVNQTMTLQLVEVTSALLPGQAMFHNESSSIVASNIVVVNFVGVEEVRVSVRNTVLSKHHTHNFTTYCTTQTSHLAYNYTCPDSSFVITHKCDGFLGMQTSYCPPAKNVCGQLNTTSSALIVNNTTCRLLNYTEHFTTKTIRYS